MSRRSVSIACLAFAVVATLADARGARAQYFLWPESSYGAPAGAYAEPEEGARRSRRQRVQYPRHDRYLLDDEASAPRAARTRRYLLDDDERPAPRAHGRGRARLASLPSDADPDYSTAVDYDDDIDTRQSRRRFVADPTGEAGGTLTIDTRARRLYLSIGGGKAVEYAIGVGRSGFAWKGEAYVGRKAFWPGWTPPPEMLERRPDLPEHMDGGLNNPLGARALYLFQGAKDTLFRIHGTNEPQSIGKAVSSGCIRMLNADVIDLYDRVIKGARVVVR